MSRPPLTRVAVYRREVAAAIERVWENVHDWEHLPWLHAASFSRIELLDSGPWGWRATLDLAPATGREFSIELVRDADGGGYVTRTLDGPGAGTEIRTRLSPRGDSTGVEVEFHVPGVEPSSAAAVGAGFTALYQRLWDEDEAMMVRRTAELARRGRPEASGEFDLGDAASLRARLPVRVELGGRQWRVVESGGALYCHALVCPHLLGPLDDCQVADGRIRCPWHGYEFDLASGACRQARGLRLPKAPRVEVADSGHVWLRL
jgi:nitrite reductase/ring-hydroxylating ferredoxin subunit